MGKAMQKLEGWDAIEGYDATNAMKEHNVAHSMAAGFQGPFVYSTMLKQLMANWQFNPFGVPEEKVAKMAIMVSYGEKDTGCPEDHGIHMGKYYSKLCNENGQQFENVAPEAVKGNAKGGKCLINHKPGGHVAHLVDVFSGALLKKFLQLVDSE